MLPKGAEQPEGCGPGCWTGSPHRSCRGSGCRAERTPCYLSVWVFNVCAAACANISANFLNAIRCQGMLLTWRQVRMRRHTRQDRGPSGWRCGPEPLGNGPSSQSRTPHSECFHLPACCSVHLKTEKELNIDSVGLCILISS